jgi:hypothetical protein
MKSSLRPQSRPFLALAVVAAAAVAVLIAYLGFGNSVGDAPAAVTQRARAQWSGNEVIHAQIVGANGRTGAEEWLDESSDASRRLERAGVPGKYRLDFVTIRNGFRIVGWSDSVVTKMDLIDPNDPWLDTASTLLRIKRGLQTGRIRVSERTVIDGRSVWVLRGRSSETGRVQALYVDRETLLPVRMDENGKVKFTVRSEEVARASLPTSFFTPEREPTKEQSFFHSQRLSYYEIGPRTPFAAFTLGQAFRGFRIGATTLETRSDPNSPFPLQPYIWFGYVRGSDIYASPVISLKQLSANSEQAQRELAVYRAQGKAYNVTVDGAERTAYVLSARGGPVVFAVVVGDTLVKGRAFLAIPEVVSMLSELRSVG